MINYTFFVGKQPEIIKPQVLKRGQRGKLKRIKEKYKDQDDDEKERKIKLMQVM